MAIQKNNDLFYGHTQNTYVKAGGMLIRETWSDEVGKLYSMEVQVDFYTNETKEYHFSQKMAKFENLRIEELTLENAYAKLIESEEFKDFISA